MIVSRSQRWRDRRDRFVPSTGLIDPRDYAVDVIHCTRQAKPFVQHHHYSASFPASRLSLGLFRNGVCGRSDLVGVATFSVPVNNASIVKHTGLQHYNQGADLGRLVLLDDVPGNAETFFLARAFRLLRREKPEILSIVSYADPMRRIAPCGRIIAPGHVGGIYRTMNAAYRGRTRPRVESFTPDGQIFSERAISKIRNGEVGHAYSVDELVRRGAPEPCVDDLSIWLRSLAESGFFTRRRHNGNHIYNFELTKAAKLASKHLPRLTYPVLDRQPCSDDVTALPLLLAA